MDELEPKTGGNKKITSSKHIGGKAVHCWIHPTGEQSFTSGASAARVEMGEVYVDTHNMAHLVYDRIKIPDDLEGYYLIEGAARFKDTSAPRMINHIYVNGSIRAFEEQSNSSSHTGEYPHVKVQTIDYLNAGDEIEIRVYHNYGSSRSLYHPGSSHAERRMQTYLRVTRLGD